MAFMRAVKLRPGKWVALGALVVSGFACASSMPVQEVLLSRYASAGDSTDNDSSFDNLDVIDSNLNGKVAVLRVGSELGENNLLSVFAGLKNKTAHRLVLELQTIYKDKEGNALNAGSWIPMTLKPHEEKEYRSAAISEDAVDFLVRVRRAPSAAAHG
jgi:hypothetical protein